MHVGICRTDLTHADMFRRRLPPPAYQARATLYQLSCSVSLQHAVVGGRHGRGGGDSLHLLRFSGRWCAWRWWGGGGG